MQSPIISNRPFQSHALTRFVRWITMVLVTSSFFIVGCSGPTPLSQMPTLLKQEPRPNTVVQTKLSASAEKKLPVGLAVIPAVSQSDSPTALSEDSLAHFTARTKYELENKVPLKIQNVVRLDSLKPGKSEEQLKALARNEKFEFLVLILTSSEETKTPAYLDASSPDVGMLPGNEIQNYALVEVALVELRSAKSLIQAHGRSYALLEQLDVPVGSNRYPLVQGSAQTNRFYPTNDTALEVLRMVALEEALDQAIMQFDNEWRDTLREPPLRRS